MRIALLLRSVLLLCSAFLLAWEPAHAQTQLPSFEQVRAGYTPSDAILLDRRGTPLADLRLNPNVRRLDWVPLSALSAAMRESLLAAEDRRFYEHTGVDWMAFAAAAWQNLWQTTKRGASTLTMQLAGLLDPALHPQGRRSLAQKWDQGRAAIELEKRWSKAQILEAYLNLAPFRGDLQGVEAASQFIFGLSANALSRREAAILAALLRGPNARPALVARRACELVTRLGEQQLCNPIADLSQTRLDQPRQQPRFTLAPHLASQFLRQPGQKLGTNLDANLQGLLVDQLGRLQSPAAAALLLDNASGEVLAWVGGLDPDQTDGVKARRLLPDWWWPHLAAVALEGRQYTAASPLYLTNVTDARGGMAAPWVSLRRALFRKHALAMRDLLAHTSRDAVIERLRDLGIDTVALPEPPDAPLEASLLQVAAAWRSYASGGNYVAPRVLPADTGTRRVVPAQSGFLVLDMLGDNRTSNTWTAAWLSTARDTHESVIVGNTDRYTLALAASASPSLPTAWRAIVGALQGGPSLRPEPPDGLVSVVVSYDPADEPPRREWFLRGTEIDHISAGINGRRARIVFPLAGQSYPLDARSEQPGGNWILDAQTSTALTWLLDGKRLGAGTRIGWQPVPGTHWLSVLDANSEVLDSLKFEVLPRDEPATPSQSGSADEPAPVPAMSR